MVASVPLVPTFVRARAAKGCERRNRDTSDVDLAPRLPQRRRPEHRGGPHAGRADRRAAVPLSARAHRIARPARRLVRDRARAGARARSLCARPAAGRGALRPGRRRRRHQRAGRRLVLSPRRRTVGAHPPARQPRRLRRPRQAQRVHARWPPADRLRRQRVDRFPEDELQRRRPRRCCASSASRSRASRPRSSARSIPRSACRAACSLRARPSGATCWWRASRRRGAPTSSRAASPTPSRWPSSWPAFRSRMRARRSSSRSTTARAIRSPARPSRRSSRSSSARATATTSSRSAAAARRWRTASRAARSASSGSAATPCRPPRRATSAIRASRASACRRRRARRRASPTSIISPTATPRSRACWCARSSRMSRAAAPWTTWCWRRSTTASSTATGRPSASGSTRPASTCATRRRACGSATCAPACRIASRPSTRCSPAST